jgi:hypothetical protein
MKIGNLVRITDAEPEDTRGVGTVLGFDTYQSQRSYPSKFVVSDRQLSRQLPIQNEECIAEVLWSDACIGWILRKRLKVLV